MFKLYSDLAESRRRLNSYNTLLISERFVMRQARFHYVQLRRAGTSAYLARRVVWHMLWIGQLYAPEIGFA